MIGSSRHELGFYKMMHPDLAAKAPEIADRLFEKNAPIAKEDFARFYREYCMENAMDPLPSVQADWWVQILTDYMYRMYSYRLASRLAEKGCQVWQYSVDFPPALHCFDQQLAFPMPGPDPFTAKREQRKSRRWVTRSTGPLFLLLKRGILTVI